MYPEIIRHLDSIAVHRVPESRQRLLQPLAEYIRLQMKRNLPVHLNFICTHNSRRSQLAQIWMQTLAWHYGVDVIHCYSGGTEATAVFPMVVNTLKDVGFRIAKTKVQKNPVYEIHYSDDAAPIFAFSKRYDDSVNPTTHFAAIMTCDQADQECPFIPGADYRISVPYDDPKAFDMSAEQALKYRERSTQIAAEMNFAVQQVLQS